MGAQCSRNAGHRQAEGGQCWPVPAPPQLSADSSTGSWAPTGCPPWRLSLVLSSGQKGVWWPLPLLFSDVTCSQRHLVG